MEWVFFAAAWPLIGIATFACGQWIDYRQNKEPLFSRKEAFFIYLLFAAFGPITTINKIEAVVIEKIRGKEMHELMKK